MHVAKAPSQFSCKIGLQQTCTGSLSCMFCNDQNKARNCFALHPQAERAGLADEFAARYAQSDLRIANEAVLARDMAERQVSDNFLNNSYLMHESS